MDSDALPQRGQRSAVHVMVGNALLTALWGWGLMYWTPTLLKPYLWIVTSGEAGRHHRSHSPLWRRGRDAIHELASDSALDAETPGAS